MSKIIVHRDPAKINLAVLELHAQAGDLAQLPTIAADVTQKAAVTTAASAQAVAAASTAANAKDTAVAAQVAASVSAGAADEAKGAAEAAAIATAEDRGAAGLAADRAEAAADVAVGARDIAVASRLAAKDSEDAAAQSAADAEASALRVDLGALDAAVDAAEAAQLAAEGHSNAASDFADNAQGSASQALAARTGAETAKGLAETAQGLAETARTGAQTAQGLAETARGQAQTARTGAQTAQGLAEAARTGAQTARTGAETAQGLAEAAQEAAETAQGLAEAARVGAEAARTGAETAEGNAAYSASVAETFASQAQHHLAMEHLFPVSLFPLPLDLYDTGLRLFSGVSERAVVAYQNSILAYIPESDISFWSGRFLPDLGKLFQDAAGTIPANQAGQPVGKVARAAGTVDASQATALSRPTLARWPKGGRRNLLTWTEDFSNATWSKVGATAAPVGGGAFNIIPAAGQKYIPEGGVKATHVAGITAGTLSVDIKHNGLRYGVVFGQVSTWFGVALQYDFTTGSLATRLIGIIGSITNEGAEEVGNGWVRVHISYTLTGYTVLVFTVSGSTVPLTGTNNRELTGDGVNGVLVRFPQVETTPVLTPYQRVTTAIDITEAGVPDVWHLWNDGGDSLPAILPAGAYEIAWVTPLGAVSYASVTSDGTTGTNLLRAERMADVLAREGALTSAEKTALEAYWQQRYAA